MEQSMGTGNCHRLLFRARCLLFTIGTGEAREEECYELCRR